MHVHASALDFLITVAYMLIAGFMFKMLAAWKPDSAFTKGIAVLTD